MDDNKFMRLAIKKAACGIKEGQTPFGACIVKNGKVICSAHNLVWGSSDITAHAEINAIRQACKKLKNIDLSDCVIYSTSEPCPMCFAACHWARIGKIVFGCRIKDAVNFGFNELAVSNLELKKLGKLNIIVKGGLLHKENMELFKKWQKLQNSAAY
jgi:guanine deaminase